VFGASGILYPDTTRSQDLGCWLVAHVPAFEAYGDVTDSTEPDNLKSGVTKACNYDPQLNPLVPGAGPEPVKGFETPVTIWYVSPPLSVG